MKNIAVLVDFTEESGMAIKQAADMANETNGELFGIHIVEAENQIAEAENKLNNFLQIHTTNDVVIHTIVAAGNLNTATQECLKKIDASMVVVCTHGIKGIKQHLFGAHILKLVQGIHYPCMVVQKQFKTDLINTKKIMLPIGPHPDYSIKIKQTASLAKMLNASIVIYEINRPGSDFENLLATNTQLAKEYFSAHNIPFASVLDELQVLSVGYSRQTVEYASNNGISIISLMANVSKNDVLFGMGDKENFLVNERGIAVFTCNN